MIIKYFGPHEARGEDDIMPEKIEFINIVELLMSIATSTEYGSKLTALSIMALVNMCNYNEDMKSIFLLKNGFPFIRTLLKSTEDEVLVNALRLLMSNVKPKDDDVK